MKCIFINRDSEGSSASEDEDVGDSDEEKLSGDFINDGDYTQASPGLDTGVAMYMAVNRQVIEVRHRRYPSNVLP